MLNNRALAASASAPKVYVEDVFSTYLYTGNSSTQTITNGIDLAGKGGLVWIKQRNSPNSNALFDTARGVNKILSSNLTYEENAFGATSNALTSFASSGFNLGADTAYAWVNSSPYLYTSWTFRKAPKFFDVVTYTGNGGTQTINHNLDSVPGCIIIKRINATQDWCVYHRAADSSLPEFTSLVLNTTTGPLFSSSFWNATLPTQIQFTVGPNVSVNASGGTYVAYIFAHNAGGFGNSGNDNVISCGSYTGNGSTSGPTVTLGWEPQWLLIKRANSTGNWSLLDNLRGLSVDSGVRLLSNTADAESVANLVRPFSTGFSLYNTSSDFNASGGTYIYIAIRRGPMKTPTAGTDVFGAYTFTSPQTFTLPTGWAPDLVTRLQRNVDDSFARLFGTRLQGNNVYLTTNSTAAENTSNTVFTFDKTAGQASAEYGGSSVNLLSYGFRRAPGFFDTVVWNGDGSYATRNHNLTVAPEFVIQKLRTGTTNGNWSVMHLQSGFYLTLNSSSAGISYTQPMTSTTFTPIIDNPTTSYVTYLFASCPGVSKVGSYTGTGTTQQINCNFTNGARFVLIKRTDSTGDWYVWDSARGIIPGNDPYLLLNSTALEVTNTDYIDAYSAGFEISSTAPAAINANGGTYIFLAIA